MLKGGIAVLKKKDTKRRNRTHKKPGPPEIEVDLSSKNRKKKE